MSDILKNYKSLLSVFSLFLLTNLVFADPTDGCELDSNTLFLTSTGDVFYNSSEAIGGFQFNVDGASVSGTSGGDAAAAGFTVQGAGSTVLGFSFTGSSIPAGCGTLTQMTFNGTASGLSGIVFSDPSGTQVPVAYYEGGGGGDHQSWGDWPGARSRCAATQAAAGAAAAQPGRDRRSRTGI